MLIKNIFFLLADCSSSVNVCQVQHLIRKSYGVGGSDCYTDCIRPTCCMIIPVFNCLYFYKEVTSLRAEMAHRGRASNYTIDQ